MAYHMTATVEMDATDFMERSEGGYDYVEGLLQSFNTAFYAELSDYFIEETAHEGVYKVEVHIDSVDDTKGDFEDWEACEYEFLSYLGENWSNVEVWEDEE